MKDNVDIGIPEIDLTIAEKPIVAGMRYVKDGVSYSRNDYFKKFGDKYRIKIEKCEVSNPSQRISLRYEYLTKGSDIKKFIEEYVDRFKPYPDVFVTLQVEEIYYE